MQEHDSSPTHFSQPNLPATTRFFIEQSNRRKTRQISFARSIHPPAQMAVQAHCLSNALPPDFQSRVEAGGILEGIQILQNYNLSRIGVNDHLQSDLACGKRKRIEPIYQQMRFINPASSNVFQVSNGSSLPVIESAVPSTSGISSASYLPFSSDVSPELLALLYQQSNEIDSLLNHQIERLRLGMQESQKRYLEQILSSLTHRAAKRLREKDIELENMNKRNAELEEKARQINAKTLIYFNLAKNNEAIVCSLKSSLEKAMMLSPVASIEGYGESNCSSIAAAGDAQSCCFETSSEFPPANCQLFRRMLCKVCNINDVCVLVLPCRHLCLCKSCDADLDTCPTCHSHKNATLQIFTS